MAKRPLYSWFQVNEAQTLRQKPCTKKLSTLFPVKSSLLRVPCCKSVPLGKSQTAAIAAKITRK
ncbi:MAG TPA: hypothetical protein VK203_28185 [Nostocaceae cyanobacterium]|nr:hypothetical protein [Nostocaceae cyanobacterium]